MSANVQGVKATVFPVVMYGKELNYEESWVPKDWCFCTVMLEKTLESPFDCKEIQPAHPKGNQPLIFNGRTDAEAEIPIFWPPDMKNWFIGKAPDAGKDWRQEEKGTTENEMAGWHHWLRDMSLSELREFVLDRKGRRAAVHGVAKSRTQLSKWPELNTFITPFWYVVSSSCQVVESNYLCTMMLRLSFICYPSKNFFLGLHILCWSQSAARDMQLCQKNGVLLWGEGG